VIATVLDHRPRQVVAAYAIVRAFGHAHSTALTISASLAQIGEFSFILAGLASRWRCCRSVARPDPGRRHSVDHAHPLLFALLHRMLAKPERTRPERTRPERNQARAGQAGVTTDAADGPPREDVPVTQLKGHVVLVATAVSGASSARPCTRPGRGCW